MERERDDDVCSRCLACALIVVICLCSYLLILDRTNWRTNLLTALLVPYLALQLPNPVFGYLRYSIIYIESTLKFREILSDLVSVHYSVLMCLVFAGVISVLGSPSLLW